LHDYAALRAINNISVVAPADNFETREAIKAAVDCPYPLYLRFGKKPMVDLHGPDTIFEFGKALTVRDGIDLTIIATGEPVYRALLAADKLAEESISCRVISMHTVKPLDTAAVLAAARETGAIITVEEHSVYGGLGEACAATLLQHGVAVPFKIVGIPDEYTITGDQFEIFDYYGISADGLAETARQLIGERV
jgi:transketolase